MKPGIDELNRKIEQVNYDKNRDIENLEEDIKLRINDLKVLKRNILEQKAEEIIEERVNEVEKQLNELVDTTNSELEDTLQNMRTQMEQIVGNAQQEIGEQITVVNQLSDKVDIKIEENKNELTKCLSDEIEIINKKIEVAGDTRELERDIINKLVEIKDNQEKFTMQKIEEQSLLEEQFDKERFEAVYKIMGEKLPKKKYETDIKKISENFKMAGENFQKLNQKIVEVQKNGEMLEKNTEKIMTMMEEKVSNNINAEIENRINQIIDSKIEATIKAYLDESLEQKIDEVINKRIKAEVERKRNKVQQVQANPVKKDIPMNNNLKNELEINSKNKIIEVAKQVGKITKSNNQKMGININKFYEYGGENGKR